MKRSETMKVDHSNYKDTLYKVKLLREMHLVGILGGAVMPEDANPDLPKDSALNYLYFTLPMALNYQRNSYTLWVSALRSHIAMKKQQEYIIPVM
jgi:hypothetical protein